MDTLVIGIDGGEWDIINGLIESGKLPNVKKIKNEGVHGPLESVTPPVSPPAWNTIQTGTNPGKHGIFDFSKFDENYTRRSVNSSDRNAPPFWKIMNDKDKTTGLFKIPFTYPPDDVDGFMVTGFPTPNTVDDFVTPKFLNDQVGPVEDLFEDSSLLRDGYFLAFKNNLVKVSNRQTEIFVDLIQKFDTDFSMIVYDGSDRVQHFFWKYFDEAHPRHDPDSSLSGAIEEYYQSVDRGIGKILDQVNGDTNVFIISDHGFGPLTKDIYIDEWLAQNGFLTRRAAGSSQKVLNDILATTMKQIWNGISRIGLAESIKSLIPTSTFESGSTLLHESDRDTIWEETQAFFTTSSGQSICINLEDKYSKGMVSSEEYDRIVDSISDSLLNLEDPKTDVKMVEAVIRADEVFNGWSVHSAPDLIVQTKQEYKLKGGRSNELVKPSKQRGNDISGDHTKEGIFMGRGPSLTEGHIEDLHILDIAPTLLYMYNLPVPETMDGSVAKDIIESDITSDREEQTTDKYGRVSNGDRTWNKGEQEELEDRLESMGYLS